MSTARDRPLYVRLSREDPPPMWRAAAPSLPDEEGGRHPLKSKVPLDGAESRAPGPSGLSRRRWARGCVTIIGVVPQAIKKRLYNPLFFR